MIKNYTDKLPTEAKKLKYHNEPGEYGGIWFQSKKEGERYLELKEMERIGLISDLQMQPKFILQENFKHKGTTIRAIKYKADFQYKRSGKVIIEDVKGTRTKVFELKKKMLLFNNPEINFIET